MFNINTSPVIADHIRSIYKENHISQSDLDQAIIDNVFAITMKFESVLLEESRPNPAVYLDAYDRWFRYLMTTAFGNHLGRKRHMQPISYAFVDVPNSRGNCSREQVSELLKSGLLHIHAVIALRPGHGQRLRRPLLVAGSAHQRRRYGDVKVEPFDPEKGSLENLIEYCMKGAKVVGRFHRSDAYDLFPRFKEARRG